ncbi:MAG: hypothetical protein VX663_10575, partial [Pseudomonadota bacterium]|nr:hypothetical protein [Pseudomonadota bacterium]
GNPASAGSLSSSTESVTSGNSVPGPIVVDGATQLTGEVSVTPPLIDLSPGTGSDIPGGVVVLNEGHVDPVVLGTLESVLVGLTVSSGGSPVSLSGISLLGESNVTILGASVENPPAVNPEVTSIVTNVSTLYLDFSILSAMSDPNQASPDYYYSLTATSGIVFAVDDPIPEWISEPFTPFIAGAQPAVINGPSVLAMTSTGTLLDGRFVAESIFVGNYADQIHSAAVPVPPAVWFLLSGLGMIGTAGRRCDQRG